MAMGNNVIATAAIGLIPTIQGVRGNIASQLGSSAVMGEANKAGQSIGSRLGSSITSSLKTGLKVGGVITGALAGITVKGGIDRALGIENARAKMSGLGHDTEAVEKIMGNALASVEGTAFGLDAAATTAAGAVAAGIKPGEQLEQTLKTVANTAAAAGTGMDEIGNVFNTVSSVGAAYTGDINMIAQRGIPIWQSLGTTLGKSQEEVKKMATEGKIDFAMFEAAAADAAGGVATAMGDTTKGSFDNMMASVRKLGAMFVTGILPLAKTTFQGIQGLLNAVKSKLEPFVNAFFERFGGSAQAGIQSFFDGLIERVENFDPTPVMNFFKEVQGGVRAFGAAWAANDGDVTSSGFPGFMEKAAYWIRQFWESIKTLDLSGVGKVFSSLGDSMKGMELPTGAGAGGAFAGIADSLKGVAEAAPGVIALGFEVLGKALKFVSDNSDTIVRFLPLIAGGLVLWKLHSTATTDALIAQRAATAAMAPVMLANNSTILLNNLLEGKSARQKTASTIATKRQTAAEKLSTAAKKTGAIATRVLGAAMKFALGPIGLIITGITLLVGALVFFFTKTETGKEIWAKVWGAIKDAAAAVVDWFMNSALPVLQAAWDGIAAGALWLYNNAIKPAWAGIKTAVQVVGDWITGTLWPALQAAWTAIGGAAMWLYGNAIKPAWDGIKLAIQVVGDWITGTLWPAIQTAWTAIGTAAMWLWNSIIKPVWNGIKVAIAIAITAILVYIDLLKWYWANVIAPVALWLYNNIIKPVWEGIKAAIGAVVVWMRDTAWPALKLAWDAIAAAAQWLYHSVILPVWNAIKGAIEATINWVRDVGWPALKLTIQWISDAFKWLYYNVILPVWNWIKGAIDAVIQWFRNTAWPVVKKVIDLYANGFKWLYNSVILPVWNWIKGAINAVVQWFKNTAWPLVKTVIDFFAGGFRLLWGIVKAVWGWIRSAISAVIQWFQNTAWPIAKMVIDFFVGGFKLLWSIVKSVWGSIKNAINAVVQWFQNVAWPLVKNVIEKLKSGFNNMRDSIKNAWKYVQDKAIQPVVGWLTGTVKPKIDTLTDNIKSAFTTMKDSVLKAWDMIKEGMKSPINGIIRIYNKHVKGNFDNVAGKLGLDTKLPEMSEFATGGYTGPGAKYKPAGIVHADEYVIRKESQNDLRRNAPGFLDSLNRYGARALGYAKGGLVKLRSPFAGSYPRGDGFGARNGRHKGIDWPMPSGAVLKAVGAGSVRHTRNAAAGNKLELTLGNGLVAGYHHLSQYIAKNGSSVGSGADVARVGSTGRSSGPHLHFSLQRDGKYVDPAPYLGAGGSAGSGDGGGWWNPFDGLWSKIKGEVSEAVGGGWIGDVLTKTASNTVGWAKDWVFDKIGEVGDFVVESGKTVAGVAGVTARWGALATRALAMTGDMNPLNHASMMRRMNQESGGNARAVNNWDSNAKKGTPSKGLMQVIPPTFRAYAHPEYNKDIFDPLSNMLASIRYTKATYGSVRRGWDRKGGYAAGGWTGPGPKYQPAGIVHADEHVIRKESRASIERARPGFLDRLNAHGAAALRGYANGGRVSPTAKIGSSKVTVILDGLVGTEKQVKSAAGKLADGIAKTFQDRFKGNQKKTVAGLADSLKALKAQSSQLKKTMSLKSSAAKKTTVNRLSDDLASLRAQAKRLDPKKQAKQLASVRKQIESTQSALTKARRGDYSGAAAATAAKLKDVQKQIASTEAALKSARSGNTSAAASKAADAFFTRYAASATAKLQSLAKQTDSLNAKLKTARTSLADAMKVRDEYATSMTEKLAGTYSLSERSGFATIDDLTANYRDATAEVKRFASLTSQLRKRGVATGLIDQVAQLGSKSGAAVAENLLSGSNSQIKSLNAAYAGLNNAASSSGKSLADSMYKSGVDAAQGLVRGLTGQLAKVNAAAQKVANSLVSTVRKTLKIKSPSRVFKEIGQFTGDGMVLGLEARVPAVRSAAESLVDPDGLVSRANRTSRPESSFRTALPASSGVGAAGAGQHFHYSPQQIDLDSEIERRQRRGFEAMVHAAKGAAGL